MRGKFLIALPLLMFAGISGASGQVPAPRLDEQPKPAVTPVDPASPSQSLFGAKLRQRSQSSFDRDTPAEKDRTMEANVRKLLGEHRAASDEAQRSKIESEVKALLKDQFAARQSIRALEITRLEEQIKQLRSVLDERNKQSERIVEDRLQHLLRNAHGLGWGGDGENSRFSADSTDPNRAAQDRFRNDSGSSDLRPK